MEYEKTRRYGMDRRVLIRKERRELLKGLNNSYTKPVLFKKGSNVPQWVEKSTNAICTFGVDVYAMKFNNEVLVVTLKDMNAKGGCMMRVDAIDKEKEITIIGYPTMFWNSRKGKFGYYAIKEYLEKRKDDYAWIKEGLQSGGKYFDRYRSQFESMQVEGLIN
jgi:hypothetical protein